MRPLGRDRRRAKPTSDSASTNAPNSHAYPVADTQPHTYTNPESDPHSHTESLHLHDLADKSVFSGERWFNDTVIRGNPADFAVTLRPVFHDGHDGRKPIPTRRAIVREDTGEAIAVVSNRYTLVPHTRILDLVEQAIQPLDVGPVPRGIYVDRQGARMRAIFKFPALASPVLGRDEICPCLQVRNTYDGSARIAVHIGAFRFVCTNLAVGGGGVFAGGFVSIHAGEIPIEKMADQLAQYLTRFDQIVGLYRHWSERRPATGSLSSIFEQSLKGRPEGLWDEVLQAAPATRSCSS